MKLKKKLSIITFIVLTNLISSQTKNICGEVTYKFTTDLAYNYVENYKLTFNNFKSYCEERGSDKEISKKTEEEKQEGLQQNFIIGRKNKTKKFYYNTRYNFYVNDNYLNNVLLFEESPLKEKWQLLNETKKLSNFSCKKATILFRGRTYIAWYSTEIPLPFGPWKLRGLPGLILELYDTDKVFHVIANNVKLSNTDCNIDLDEKKLTNILTLSNYLDKKEELLDKMFAKMSSKRPKGTKPFKRDKNCNDCRKSVEIFNENK